MPREVRSLWSKRELRGQYIDFDLQMHRESKIGIGYVLLIFFYIICNAWLLVYGIWYTEYSNRASVRVSDPHCLNANAAFFLIVFVFVGHFFSNFACFFVGHFF